MVAQFALAGSLSILRTLSLHDALPIVGRASCRERVYIRKCILGMRIIYIYI